MKHNENDDLKLLARNNYKNAIKNKISIEKNRKFNKETNDMKKELNIVISSNNPHKIEEFKEIFVDYPNVKILSLEDLNINVNPEENGETFKDNSFIKANAIAKLTNYPVIADDSGLEIDSLN